MNRRYMKMAKKAKEVKENDKLLLENLKVGDKILDLHNEEIEITEDLIEQMKRFEKETKKSSIRRGKITGGFLYFKQIEEHPEEKNKSKKSKKVEEESIEEIIEESLDEEIEAEVHHEEDMLLDAMEDYKMEYNVKTVNTKSQKFKRFLYKWKQDN